MCNCEVVSDPAVQDTSFAWQFSDNLSRTGACR